MPGPQSDRLILSVVSDYLVSLPFDLKVLQEAVTDPDLDRPVRDIAAGTIVHTLLPQEGEKPFCYIDDVLLVRATFDLIRARGGAEGFDGYRQRFSEIYDSLDRDLEIFSKGLGDNWKWLSAKLEGFPKLVLKGRRAAQYVDDDEGQSALYDEGLEFETNYTVTEEQVRNRLRRTEQVAEIIQKKRTEEAKKIG